MNTEKFIDLDGPYRENGSSEMNTVGMARAAIGSKQSKGGPITHRTAVGATRRPFRLGRQNNPALIVLGVVARLIAARPRAIRPRAIEPPPHSRGASARRIISLLSVFSIRAAELGIVRRSLSRASDCPGGPDAPVGAALVHFI
jgi:hypothetical protein